LVRAGLKKELKHGVTGANSIGSCPGGEDFVMEMSPVAGRELARKKPEPKRNEDN